MAAVARANGVRIVFATWAYSEWRSHRPPRSRSAHPAGRGVRRTRSWATRPPPLPDCGRGGASSASAAPPTSPRSTSCPRDPPGARGPVSSAAHTTRCGLAPSSRPGLAGPRGYTNRNTNVRCWRTRSAPVAGSAPSRPAAALRVGDGVPHPVPWTHIYATPLDVARTPRALQSACDTPAFQGASSGCIARRTRRRRHAHRRASERPARRSLAP